MHGTDTHGRSHPLARHLDAGSTRQNYVSNG